MDHDYTSFQLLSYAIVGVVVMTAVCAGIYFHSLRKQEGRITSRVMRLKRPMVVVTDRYGRKPRPMHEDDMVYMRAGFRESGPALKIESIGDGVVNVGAGPDTIRTSVHLVTYEPA